MLKRFLLTVLLVALLLCLGRILVLRAGEIDDDLPASRFKLIYDDAQYRVIVDQRTGVEYIRDVRGGICALIDSYGNPVLYPGFDAREDRPV